MRETFYTTLTIFTVKTTICQKHFFFRKIRYGEPVLLQSFLILRINQIFLDRCISTFRILLIAKIINFVHQVTCAKPVFYMGYRFYSLRGVFVSPNEKWGTRQSFFTVLIVFFFRSIRSVKRVECSNFFQQFYRTSRNFFHQTRYGDQMFSNCTEQ